jgi:hypothetical protein
LCIGIAPILTVVFIPSGTTVNTVHNVSVLTYTEL